MGSKIDINKLINDPDRLAALRNTGLLDSPDELAFDSLTRLVCLNLNAPMSLVTFVDEKRQFFKSQSGLAILEREAPLNHSVCKYVILEKSVLVIEDVRTHPLTLDKLALPSMGCMAYCGAPLISEDQIIGSLCAVDSKPREWTAEQILALEDLANIATLQIEAHKLKNKASDNHIECPSNVLT